MTPPNTVPITAEELNYIQRTPEAKFFVWCFVDAKRWVAEDTDNPYLYCRNDVKEMRIAAHDYRHYFGEVVDLKEYLNPTDGRAEFLYLGNRFTFMVKDNQYAICTAFKDHFKGSFDECQQWLCDHFTALFKKDLPHLNIKFVWS